MKTEDKLKQLFFLTCPDGNITRTHKFEDEEVDLALSIFLEIKKYERSQEDVSELEFAKKDLKEIFGIDTKKMTPNVIYNKHQTMLVNAFAKLLKEKEMNFEVTSFIINLDIDDSEWKELK